MHNKYILGSNFRYIQIHVVIIKKRVQPMSGSNKINAKQLLEKKRNAYNNIIRTIITYYRTAEICVPINIILS
jgi:hypothetical protein